MSLSVNISLESIKCVICFSYPVKYLYVCDSGTHIVCGECFECYSKTCCPICGEMSSITRARYLERLIYKTCPNEGCQINILPIDEEHIKNCKYSYQKCCYCDTDINLLNIGYHLMEKHSWIYSQKNNFNFLDDTSKYIIESGYDDINKTYKKILLIDNSGDVAKIACISTNKSTIYKNMSGFNKERNCSIKIDIPTSYKLEDIIWISFDKFYNLVKLNYFEYGYETENWNEEEEEEDEIYTFSDTDSYPSDSE